VGNEFAGRVALVTGAGGAAIGAATCRRLASEGAAIVAVDHHEKRCNQIAADIQGEYGVGVLACPVDIADRPAIDQVVSDAAKQLGAIDILVNSAAINVQGSIFDYDPADFDQVINVDLNACWYLIRAVLPGMRDKGGGTIVNVTSLAAFLGGRGHEAPYSAAKAAMHEITRSTAIEGGPHGIRCNAVAPGLVESKFLENHRERLQPLADETPLRRFAKPEEIAEIIAFLASERSSYITGDVLNASGGWYLTA
jgi:NAD(P)-dependent dehydrogenase (short-subunit alcohol dehydrogenase family)